MQIITCKIPHHNLRNSSPGPYHTLLPIRSSATPFHNNDWKVPYFKTRMYTNGLKCPSSQLACAERLIRISSKRCNLFWQWTRNDSESVCFTGTWMNMRYTSIPTYIIHALMHIDTRVHTNIDTRVQPYIYTYTCAYIYTYTCAYVHRFSCPNTPPCPNLPPTNALPTTYPHP